MDESVDKVNMVWYCIKGCKTMPKTVGTSIVAQWMCKDNTPTEEKSFYDKD